MSTCTATFSKDNRIFVGGFLTSLENQNFEHPGSRACGKGEFKSQAWMTIASYMHNISLTCYRILLVSTTASQKVFFRIHSMRREIFHA